MGYRPNGANASTGAPMKARVNHTKTFVPSSEHSSEMNTSKAILNHQWEKLTYDNLRGAAGAGEELLNRM